MMTCMGISERVEANKNVVVSSTVNGACRMVEFTRSNSVEVNINDGKISIITSPFKLAQMLSPICQVYPL